MTAWQIRRSAYQGDEVTSLFPTAGEALGYAVAELNEKGEGALDGWGLFSQIEGREWLIPWLDGPHLRLAAAVAREDGSALVELVHRLQHVEEQLNELLRWRENLNSARL